MAATLVETIWLLHLASKCQSLSSTNIFFLAFLLLLSWLLLTLLFWAHPGGPAWATRFSRNPIPGPKGFPIIGSINLMSGLAHRNLAAAAHACRATRLMAFSIGQTRAVVTAHPDVAKHILNSSAFTDRPAKESAYSLMFNRAIGFAPYGVYWTTLRKISAAHLFCPKQIKASEHHRLEIGEQMVAMLGSGVGGNVCVRDVLKFASLNNMMWAVFGRKYDLGSARNADAAELKDLVEKGYDLLGEVNWSDHFSFLSELDIQRVRFRCAQLVPRVNRFVGRIMEEHKQRITMSNDFVDVLLSLKGLDRLSDSDMISVLWEMIFRGTDTVAVLIEWILARLVLHPDVQAKVHHELDAVTGSRAVTESDLTELVYLNAVIREVLRLHPPGPLLSWSRLSVRDTVVDGYKVPRGTTAIVNMWAITRDPKFWPEPLQFKPERFLGQDPNSVLGSDLRLAPFGSGRRSCPGKTLGLTTVGLWVAKLLQEFEFTGGDKSEVELSEVLRLSCEMANPLVVRIRSRRCQSGC